MVHNFVGVSPKKSKYLRTTVFLRFRIRYAVCQPGEIRYLAVGRQVIPASISQPVKLDLTLVVFHRFAALALFPALASDHGMHS